MKKLVKKLSITSPLLVALMLISGCSNPVEISVQTATLVSEEELATKYSTLNPITVDFWTGFGSDMSDQLTNNEGTGVLDEFMDKYPYIKVNHVSKGGYTNLRDAVNLSVTSRSYPNVAVGYPDHFAGYISKNIQYVLDDFIEHETLGIDLNDFNSDFLKENQTLLYKDDAKTQPYTMGIPFNKSTEVMVYNKTFFDYFELNVPTTWSEVETVSAQILGIMTNNYNKQVKDKDNNVVFDFTGITAKDFRPISYDSLANMFITGVRQWGGEYTQMGETIEKGYVKFNNPQALAFLDFCNSIYDKNYIGIAQTWGEAQYCSNPFKALKSVMTISSSAGVKNNIAAGNKYKVGIAPIPYKDADKKFVISQGTNLAMFKGSKEKNTAAWLLIKYLTADEGNYNFAINTGYLPVTSSGVQSETYQSFLNTKVGTDSDLARIAVAKLAEEVYGATKTVGGVKVNEWTRFVDPAFRGSSTIRDQVEDIVKLIYYGLDGKRYTPQEAIDYTYSRLSDYR